MIGVVRLLGITGLPYGPTTGPFSRVVRLGERTWAKVSLVPTGSCGLPFGDDRLVLAGVTHLALEGQSPLVEFENINTLLKMFNIGTDGRGYRRLRARLQRLSNVSVSILIANSEADLDRDPVGPSKVLNWHLVSASVLPGQRELRSGQKQLALEFGDQFIHCGVLLDGDYFEHAQHSSSQLWMPLEILRSFAGDPLGWDLAMFLVHRCGAAKSRSTVPEEQLLGLFRQGRKERTRSVMQRLRLALERVHKATDGQLKARLVETLEAPTGPGRRLKRWGLEIEPSRLLRVGPAGTVSVTS